MLPPAWGYVDQPPLTPWLARTFTSVVADEAWAVRIPATLASAASVVILGLITRELGGDRRAVAFAAWGAAFAGLPLALGHVLLTSTIDLPLTLAVVLTVLLALRTNPRWWLAAGARPRDRPARPSARAPGRFVHDVSVADPPTSAVSPASSRCARRDPAGILTDLGPRGTLSLRAHHRNWLRRPDERP